MASAEPERQLVVFSLHGEDYALPITAVREIIRYVKPGATAAASGAIQGMISFRGRLLPLVDLSSRLGRQLETGRDTRILVVEVSNGSLGLIVDAVDGIVRVPERQIEPFPAAADKGLGEGIAVVGDRLIVLIDAERALGELLGGRPATQVEPTTDAIRRRPEPPPDPPGSRSPHRRGGRGWS
jgi:purine-binding chemotaxis protein CheW